MFFFTSLYQKFSFDVESEKTIRKDRKKKMKGLKVIISKYL